MKRLPLFPLFTVAILLFGLAGCTADDGSDARSTVRMQIASLNGGTSVATRASASSTGPIDAWNNTTIGVAYRTAANYSDGTKSEVVIADNTGNTTVDLGIEYPAATGTITVRGFYPPQELEADGTLLYDLGMANRDVMLSQTELSGTRTAKITNVMKFQHLLTRVTFNLKAQSGTTFTQKVIGIRIAPRDADTPMREAVIDLTKDIGAEGCLTFRKMGAVANINLNGFGSVPASDATTPLSIDVLFRPDVAFDMYVLSENGVSMKVESDDAAVTTLCADGGDAGKCYTISLNMSDENIAATMGDWETVTAEDKMDGPTANCFMLHPNSSKTVSLNIPLNNINEFWDGNTSIGHGTAANKLNVGDTWTASILWSDITAINQGAIATYVPKHTGRYTVFNDDYFTVALPAGFNTEGNFVVQVKNASNVVLWSWHIWVTAYDPDALVAAKGSMAANTYYTNTVASPNGQIETYGTTTIMMDRNIGQSSPTTGNHLYYQFGRKDPFSASSTPRLGITAGTKTIAQSVQSPLSFITMSSNINWCSENSDISYLWNDPTVASYITSASKSLYDPCPSGWRVPVTGTWDVFTTKTFLWRGANGFNGRRYATSNSLYVANGLLNNSTSDLTYFGNHGGYWVASPSPFDVNKGDYFYFNDGTRVYPSTQGRPTGAPVRCSRGE
jgi:hypothetical protein